MKASQFLFNTSFFLADISGFETRNQFTPFQHFVSVEYNVPVIPEDMPYPIIAINITTTGNPVVDAFYIKQKNNRNIDCTITPIGKLNKNECPENVPGTGALGEATARPGNPVNNFIASVNLWVKMATGAINQP